MSDGGKPPGVGDGAYYERWYSDRDWRFYRGIMSRVLSHAEPGPVLDMGAGTGFLVEAFTRWGMDCAGVDGSPEAVAIGLKRYPGLKLRHHRLGEPFPMAGGSFSVAILNQVIEHLDRDVAAAALREAHRVLRSGGLMLVASPSRFNTKEWRADPTHVHLYSPGELARLLTECGFLGVRPFDQPFPWLGSGAAGQAAMLGIYRLLRRERLSATANAMAFKP